MTCVPKLLTRAVTVVAVAAMLTVSMARAEAPTDRATALAAMRDIDAATRAEAIAWIANHGTLADAPLLHERLRDDSPLVRAYAEQGLWLLWSRSGEPAIDALMARGVEQMEAGEYPQSVATFSEVIRKRPDFAEGWNKRATVLFLAGEYRRSIADCDEVLKRNPRHFGALAGLGQIYLRLDEPERALGWLRKALEVNPNLAGVERMIEDIEQTLREKRARTI